MTGDEPIRVIQITRSGEDEGFLGRFLTVRLESSSGRAGNVSLSWRGGIENSSQTLVTGLATLNSMR